MNISTTKHFRERTKERAFSFLSRGSTQHIIDMFKVAIENANVGKLQIKKGKGETYKLEFSGYNIVFEYSDGNYKLVTFY